MFWSSEPGLWPGRCRTDGRLQITRMTPPPPPPPALARSRSGDGYPGRRARRSALLWRTLVGVVLAGVALAHADPASTPLVLLLGGVLIAAIVAVALGSAASAPSSVRRPGRSALPDAAQEAWQARAQLEQQMAATGSLEARVAAAACRAWRETLQERSWSSPVLELTRVTFDGDGEVDAIIDLALRIHDARAQLGPAPSERVRDYWRQQRDALDASARRLGDRADALIRQRDLAAQLTAELDHLRELERLDRSAIVVDDLTYETAAGRDIPGQPSVAEQIQTARTTIADLVDSMHRTRPPLAESATHDSR
jgi:hypothetical protein